MSYEAEAGFEDLPILAELRELLSVEFEVVDRRRHTTRQSRARRRGSLSVIAALVLGAATAGALAAAGATTPPSISAGPQEVVLNPGTGAVLSVTPLSAEAYRAIQVAAGEIATPNAPGG
jgi:hypothetical protein